MSVSQDIKDRLDLVEVVQEYLPLRKSGQSYTGFCPFHANTRTPSFVVFPQTQTWRCFGACSEGGDLFSFVMKKEGWDFREALEQMARRAGVELEPPSPRQQAQAAAQERLTDLLSLAADYYHQLLLYAPQAEGARQYLEKRGLAPETVEAFNLGYALPGWDAARTHFNAQGFANDHLLDAGLLSQNEERGTTYDRFRARLMIPIRDLSGQVVGFGARTLEPDGLPKYLNSPQTAAFNKSHLLFGLDMARRYVREARQAVIVEGYMDVMQAWQAGFRNVVAQMGTALTSEQLALLKRFTRRFVIALDADDAGMNATLRSLDVARDSLDRAPEFGFDARGLVRQEGRLQAEIHVVTLPAGKDPDNILRQEPALWPKLLEEARPVVAYVIDVLTRSLEPDDARGKAGVAERILPLIADIASPVERAHYRGVLARSLGVDERALRQVALPATRQRAATAARQGPPPPAAPPPEEELAPFAPRRRMPKLGRTMNTEMREANYLRQVIEQPWLMAQVDERLERHKLPPVAVEEFSSLEDRALCRHLHQVAAQGQVVSVDELCDKLAEPLASRLQRLLTIPATVEGSTVRLADSLTLSVLDWRQEKTKALLAEVKQLIGLAQAQGEEDLAALYGEQLRQLPATLQRINRARGAMSAMYRRRREDAGRRA